MIPTIIHARDLPEAWFLVLAGLYDPNNGLHRYPVQHGSYQGQHRLEYDALVVDIRHPESMPMVPDMPPGCPIPPPTDMEYVQRYFERYFLTDIIEPGETYTYGCWIAPRVEAIIRLLKKTPKTNQAVINIGGWLELPLVGLVNVDEREDPPCLRTIHWRVMDDTLHVSVFLRSWDLWGGFPANLAAVQLLNELVAETCGYKTGTITAFSTGAHLYDHAWELAESRIGPVLAGRGEGWERPTNG